ncbi:hypothetical protein MSAN_00943500 [Mycena sanguinolenta]|uniref:Uncharacterized protein n=1 Tax=Mycena sanguinolenta TaxID=230812 RepID=A0A8H7D951_9AGAR|nr:hypothetical protein MSAN_00943500 [Mycena sanguinolenta]
MASKLFGDPIICDSYDLEDALKAENDVRMAREDLGAPSDDEEIELEDPTPRLSRARRPSSPRNPVAAPELTGKAKKKHQKRERERFGFGCGRKEVGNYKARSQKNREAMDDLMENEDVQRFATYPIPAFQALSFNIFSDYHETKRTLLDRNPHLDETFRGSPFAAVTANLGPRSVSPPHLDSANKADGMCLIGALGRFNPDNGGHLVLWDYNLMIRFPPGRSAFIPSAVVTHSNTPIADDEERFSLLQYSGGSLFRWVDNGFQTDLSWKASATPEGLEQ